MSKEFTTNIEVRWSDLDPNFHVRHSVYYDWGAYMRTVLLAKYGLTLKIMQENNFGPIIFREECVFKKELKFGDTIEIDLTMLKAKKDFSRWSLQHHIYKDKELAAVLTIDGAWLDTQKRKLTIPPEEASNLFGIIPKSEDFSFLD